VSAAKNSSALDDAFIAVWQQALVDRAKKVALGNKSYPVRSTLKRALAQVDFEVDGMPYRGLEQNPQTKSRWAELARKGAQVMQFLLAGRYIAAVVAGKVTHYTQPGRDKG
jgi:hypothetical protein